ncbi:matrixin family metalloprotease [Listeria seeligeri]|uniref:matrixin family metalloprotease n=1 Tax=Listeria seeligeri TaxID=1640 RepID=UPI00162A61F5|nr:matrixin family metalloprotease [Listeria seeligeri]MBC1722229.1 matrixin family metalloprotease [Listeria seeligeri]MBF2435756.1 matrixin family metalloprotease [Listeria seeligeri]
MGKRKSTIILFTVLSICVLLNPVKGEAYVLNSQKMTSPKSITYFNNSSIIKEKLDSYMTYATKWNYSGSQVKVGKSIGAVGVEIKNSYDNRNTGAYATTYYTSKHSAKIVYYRAFKNTSATNKRETVVHEVGHTIGLSHTQSKNNSSSVMRKTKFNGKAYPLSDDKKGVNAKY